MMKELFACIFGFDMENTCLCNFCAVSKINYRSLFSFIFRFVFIFTLNISVFAGSGLRTPLGEAIVENLQIGNEYSLKDLVNLPLRIINSGDKITNVRVDLLIPQKDELKKGYEQIPDLNWIKLPSREFLGIPSQGEAVTDIIISIPNDKKYLGKRYQFFIWSRTFGVGQLTLAVGIKSRICFSVSSIEPEPENTGKKVKMKMSNINFNFRPLKVELPDVIIGKKIDLKKEYNVQYKIINPNDETLTFKIKSVAPWEVFVEEGGGYVNTPEIGWLTVKPDTIKIKPDEVAKINVYLQIPNDPKYKNKKYLFTLKAEPIEQDIPVGIVSKILVTTSGDEDSIKKKDVKVIEE